MRRFTGQLATRKFVHHSPNLHEIVDKCFAELIIRLGLRVVIVSSCVRTCCNVRMNTRLKRRWRHYVLRTLRGSDSGLCKRSRSSCRAKSPCWVRSCCGGRMDSLRRRWRRTCRILGVWSGKKLECCIWSTSWRRWRTWFLSSIRTRCGSRMGSLRSRRRRSTCRTLGVWSGGKAEAECWNRTKFWTRWRTWFLICIRTWRASRVGSLRWRWRRKFHNFRFWSRSRLGLRKRSMNSPSSRIPWFPDNLRMELMRWCAYKVVIQLQIMPLGVLRKYTSSTSHRVSWSIFPKIVKKGAGKTSDCFWRIFIGNMW